MVLLVEGTGTAAAAERVRLGVALTVEGYEENERREEEKLSTHPKDEVPIHRKKTQPVSIPEFLTHSNRIEPFV